MGEITREGESAIPELLELFPVLNEFLDRPGRALSGGEQQILALARCLVGRPKLLLLDEPTEGVQPSIVEQIAEKLVQLTTMFNLTVLLVEQDLHFIAQLANRVPDHSEGSDRGRDRTGAALRASDRPTSIWASEPAAQAARARWRSTSRLRGIDAALRRAFRGKLRVVTKGARIARTPTPN